MNMFSCFSIKCTFWYCAPVFFFFFSCLIGRASKVFRLRRNTLSRAVPSGDLLLDLVIFTEEIRNGKLHFLCSLFSCHQTFMLAREFPQALKLQFCWICYHIVGISSLMLFMNLHLVFLGLHLHLFLLHKLQYH